MAEEFGERFLRGAADREGILRGKRREAAEQDGGNGSSSGGSGGRGTASERRATLGIGRGRGPAARLGGMSGGAANRVGGSGL